MLNALTENIFKIDTIDACCADDCCSAAVVLHNLLRDSLVSELSWGQHGSRDCSARQES